jgi:hypothetical protein
MDNINNTPVDVSFIDNDMIITYDNELTETLVVGKETYDKMYKEWLKEQPPFISDVYKQMMNNIILTVIHNNKKCVAELNSFFRVENKDEVINFIKYMRGRDLTQEKLKWNKPLGDLYNKPVDQQTPQQ